MRITLILLVSLFCCQLVSAQVNVEATPTGRHAKVLNTAKQKRAEAKRRKQQLKEARKRIKAQQEARKIYFEQYDSIRISKRDSSIAAYWELPDSLRYSNISFYDSLTLNIISKEDSLAIANQVLSSIGFPEEYKDLMIVPPIRLDSTWKKPDNLDSLLIEKGEGLADQVAREHLTNGLNAQSNSALASFEQQTSQISTIDPKSLSKPNPNLIKQDQVEALLKKVDPEKFQEVQQGLQKLKRKYSEMPDSRYPKEGTRRNSLKDLPFLKRLDITGNVGLQSTDPLILDSRIQLGYWINKKWLGGLGLTIREQFTGQDSIAALSGDGFGYSLYTRYNLPKSFFAWGEMEWQVNRSVFGLERRMPTSWQQAHLLGIGREFKIRMVQMMSIIMYDFNYRNNDLHPRPIVFRIGVRFTKRP